MQNLRMHAIREGLGKVVGADRMIDAALRALLEAVESPSLFLLAGLSRRDEGEAHDLFRSVVEELDIAPPMPLHSRTERWNLVRLLCEAIADEDIEPEIGGRMIWEEGWNELDYPVALQPLIGTVSEWEDWDPSWNVERDDYRRMIVQESRRLLMVRWPPD